MLLSCITQMLLLLLCTFFVFQDCYLREKENTPRMCTKQLGVPSSGCEALVWPQRGYKCLSGGKSSKWPIFGWAHRLARREGGSGWQDEEAGAERPLGQQCGSRTATAVMLPAGVVTLSTTGWDASLWATSTKPWQPLEELGSQGSI